MQSGSDQCIDAATMEVHLEHEATPSLVLLTLGSGIESCETYIITLNASSANEHHELYQPPLHTTIDL